VLEDLHAPKILAREATALRRGATLLTTGP
jgi:hypothetical protein